MRRLLGPLLGCVWLTLLGCDSETAPTPKPSTRTTQSADTARGPLFANCAEKGHPLCLKEARRHMLQATADAFLQLAIRRFKTQCDLGVFEACRSLDDIYPYIAHRPSDWAQAVELSQAACKAGSLDTCDARMRILSDSRRQSYEQSRLLQRSLEADCKRKDVPACRDWALSQHGWLGDGSSKGEAVRDAFAFACDAGDALSCVHTGRIHRDGRKVEVSIGAAKEAFAKACSSEVGLGCRELAALSETAAALPYLERGCKHGDLVACDRVAATLGSGASPSEGSRARELLSTACEQGHLPACRQLAQTSCAGGDSLACVEYGLYLQHGYGGGKNWTKARSQLKEACDKGIATACTAFATGLEQYGPLRQVGHADAGADSARALEHEYALLCEAGHAAACRMQAQLAVGLDSDKRASRQIRLLRVACKHGSGPACYDLGQRYRTGAQLAKNADAARAQFARACKANLAKGCEALAYELANDATQARGWFERACTLGQAHSCYQYANWVGQGRAGRQDRVEAKSIFRRACDMGNEFACKDWLMPSWESPPQGETWEERTQRYVERLRTGCSQGDAALCRQLGVQLASHSKNREQNLKEARASHLKACLLGDAVGCQLRARVLSWTPRLDDPLESWVRRQQACDRRPLGESCKAASDDHNYGRVVAPDALRARALLARACEADPTAMHCATVEAAFTRLMPSQPDATRARELYVAACAAQDALACRHLARMERDGWGGPQDTVAAQARYVKNCEHDAVSCYEAGRGYAVGGRGLSTDADNALHMYEAGCARHNRISCIWLAFAHEDASATQPANAVFERLCEQDFGLACRHRALAAFKSNDRETSKRFLKRACGLGEGASCKWDPFNPDDKPKERQPTRSVPRRR